MVSQSASQLGKVAVRKEKKFPIVLLLKLYETIKKIWKNLKYKILGEKCVCWRHFGNRRTKFWVMFNEILTQFTRTMRKCRDVSEKY